MPFSVLTEPVIPVLMPDGNKKTVGIRELFLEAHHIRDISGSNPLERYALLRLIIAFAMDMLHPETSYDRADLLQAGHFDAAKLDEYIRACEKEGPRFDLFDPEHPFLQSRYDEELDNGKIKSVANICPMYPQGNNHVFVDHHFETEHALTASQAFRSLCVFYLFCFPVGAKGYPSSVNNTPPIYAVVVGSSLFETIIVNLLSVSELGSIPYGIGSVPWRGNNSVEPKKTFANISVIEAYTWQPRRITLIRDDDGLVRQLYIQPGHDFKGNDLWRDPQVPYRKKKDNSYSSIKPEMGRMLWRDVSSLIYDMNHGSFYQPAVISHIIDVYEEGSIPAILNIRIVGLVLSNNAKYEIWYEDMLSLPSVLMNDEVKASVFRDDIGLIESVQSMIYSSVQRYYDKSRENSAGNEHETATQCRQYFLKMAHDLLFGEDLKDILCGTSQADHGKLFTGRVKSLIRETLTRVLYCAGNDTESMMKQIETEKWIWINYHKLVKEREGEYAGS